MTRDSGSRSLVAPAQCTPHKNHNSASPSARLAKSKNCFPENRTHASQIMATHNEATSRQHGGDDALRVGGNGALCVGDALGEEELNRKRDKKDKIGGLTSGD